MRCVTEARPLAEALLGTFLLQLGHWNVIAFSTGLGQHGSPPCVLYVDTVMIDARAGWCCYFVSCFMQVYVHRLRRYFGAYLLQLGHVDAIIFSAGVGEHSPEIRRRALAGLQVPLRQCPCCQLPLAKLPLRADTTLLEHASVAHAPGAALAV